MYIRNRSATSCVGVGKKSLLQWKVNSILFTRSCFSYNRQDSKSKSSSRRGDQNEHKNSFGSSKEQFDSQRSEYHRHSFHSKGEASGSGGTEKLHKGPNATFTAQEKKSLASRWENAFFNRVHFEEGMHQRYAEAVKAEEMENEDEKKRFFGDEENGTMSRDASAANPRGSSWFPHWCEDEVAPRNLFHCLTAKQKLSFIVERLLKGERRIQFSPDYGGLSMMAQLNLGEFMLKDAENLLLELEWMTPEVQSKIDQLKELAARIKFDYDLD